MQTQEFVLDSEGWCFPVGGHVPQNDLDEGTRITQYIGRCIGELQQRKRGRTAHIVYRRNRRFVT